ncbi:MAG: Transcriptional regulator, Crp/Fnr family [Candidatus Woesebacteria bacterium GW2011_GWD1_38_10]|uniref:Transcriptional regulator, Crp/Fnr family n=1 Tax=Candidatus Woesebacteria bacterium GW2011_GWD1_38_10 TaxID=1618592 RepID=A0A0G0HW73_9BACT|nr:MAG: Transcriptional regulator, Crp/Fnr family [Candidatus Woesebacteria bacterium GW2011_GWD1_38_10]HAP37953.1 hypothetical protein [Candidatus Shapirobacteria bacterium]HBP51377.1 hypothetical protein [Candidatus Shapirobacteria bacterium]
MGWTKPSGKIASFFKTGPQYRYKKGEIIIRPEDIPSGIYYVEKGFIKAYSITLDGSENIFLFLQPGGIFPGHWQYSPNEESKHYYEAISPVILHRKAKVDFDTLITSDLEASREIHAVMLDVVNTLAQRIENLEHTNAYARVVLHLLGLAMVFGNQKENKITLEVPLTHYDFAHSINMSRETASRELEKLKKKNLISEKNHLITITDSQKLRQEFDVFYENK